MNIFFDTNVLLDVALRREPHFEKSNEALTDAIENHHCFMSWHTVSNLSYILGRLEGKEVAMDFIRHIAEVCRISPVDHDDLAVAFEYDGGDFEDAMQIASALACDAEIIVTRDASGFCMSPLPVSSTTS